MSTGSSTGDAGLDGELERLLEIETFGPPTDFAAKANVRDRSLYEQAEADPQAYWAGQAKALHWFTEPTKILDDSNPPFYKWFTDGRLNVSYNCLDRHVDAGKGDKVAFHWRGEEGEERDITYADLLRDTQKLANGLKSLGVGKGDVVGIFLPMIPEVAVAMLACTRIGAVHNVVFGGFSVGAVRERMEVSEAKALITVDGARRKGKTAAIKSAVDEEMGSLDSLKSIIVVRSTGTDCAMQAGRDVWYHDLVDAADAECPAEPMEAEAPLYILYSSGSTAKPKGILHTTGGYLTQVAYTHRLVFDLKPDEDIYWCSADVGWVTGHSYIVYGPLANGATSVMYEGAPDYPDKDIWWEIVERYKVTIFYTAPTAIRACIKWGHEYPDKHDLSSLRLLGSVGEPINPKAWLWYHKVIGGERCPIVDTWWQTETGAIMISPLPGLTATKPGSATQPLPGISAEIVDEDGKPVGEGTGVLVLTRPWPGMLRTLYGDDERFVSTYFSRFGKQTYLVGDAARKDSDGYFWIIGRIDDVINVSGHRLSTAEVESAIVSHEGVAEAAVVAQTDEDTGQAIVAFVTLEGSREASDDMVLELREHVAKRIGKLARPKRIIWADDLPKTRSGKIMRRLLRDIAEGRELGDVTTLRDPDVMKQLSEKVSARQSEE
jgi:acetyl-CoA synthetase